MNETRVALTSIIIEDPEAAHAVNEILHIYSSYIIGRMGLPYKAKNISIISIALDAPQSEISAMTGKIGRINGVTTKTVYSNF